MAAAPRPGRRPDRWHDPTAERILDAAGETFRDLGIAGTGMADIGRAAGCSRATVYRYFENRTALRVAYVDREAVRVATDLGRRVARVDDPLDRVSAAILGAVETVRATPTLAAWFTPEGLGITAELASSSHVIDELAAGLLGGAEHREAARWIVRVIVSLLAMPEADPSAERSLVERFVAPTLGAELAAPVSR